MTNGDATPRDSTAIASTSSGSIISQRVAHAKPALCARLFVGSLRRRSSRTQHAGSVGAWPDGHAQKQRIPKRQVVMAMNIV